MPQVTKFSDYMSPAFRKLVALANRCSDATVGGCEACNVFAECVGWWDTQGITGVPGVIDKWRVKIRSKKHGPREDQTVPEWIT